MAKRITRAQPISGKTAFNFSHILYEKNEYVATLTINRPEVLNCLNLTTLREMLVAIEDASWDDDIAVLVITGAGDRAFSTGADLAGAGRILPQQSRTTTTNGCASSSRCTSVCVTSANQRSHA